MLVSVTTILYLFITLHIINLYFLYIFKNMKLQQMVFEFYWYFHSIPLNFICLNLIYTEYLIQAYFFKTSFRQKVTPLQDTSNTVMRDNDNKYSDTTDFIYKAKEQLKQDTMQWTQQRQTNNNKINKFVQGREGHDNASFTNEFISCDIADTITRGKDWLEIYVEAGIETGLILIDLWSIQIFVPNTRNFRCRSSPVLRQRKWHAMKFYQFRSRR